MKHTLVVIGGNPGQQLKTFDVNRVMPPRFEPMDRTEIRLWRALAIAAGELEPGATVEQLLKVLQEAKVSGMEDAEVLGEHIGHMRTDNPKAEYRNIEMGKPKGYFLHRNGTRTARLTAGDLDIEGMKARRREVARARYRDFAEVTMGLEKPPEVTELALRHVERGLTFNNAVMRGQQDWLNAPFVQAVFEHRWAEDEEEPQRGGDNFFYNCGVANEFDPMRMFCQEYPDPEAEFIRREAHMAAVPWIYVHNSEWHDHLWDALEADPESLLDGVKASEFRENWAARVQELYRTVPPHTRLTAAMADL